MPAIEHPLSTPVTRFAPSPNGLLHAGHALSAIIAYDMARDLGGRFLVRIEDIDIARARPEFVTAIYRGSRLAWAHLGTAGAGAIAAFPGLSGRRRPADRAGFAVSVFCLARGYGRCRHRSCSTVSGVLTLTARRFIAGSGKPRRKRRLPNGSQMAKRRLCGSIWRRR